MPLKRSLTGLIYGAVEGLLWLVKDASFEEIQGFFRGRNIRLFKRYIQISIIRCKGIIIILILYTCYVVYKHYYYIIIILLVL